MKKLFLAVLSVGLFTNALQFATEEQPITANQLNNTLAQYKKLDPVKQAEQEKTFVGHLIALTKECYTGSKQGITNISGNIASIKKHKFLAVLFNSNYVLSKIAPGILTGYGIDFVKKAITDNQKNASYFWGFAAATFATAIVTDKIYDWLITPNVTSYVKKHLEEGEENLAAWDKDKSGALFYATTATTILLLNKYAPLNCIKKSFNYAKSFVVPVAA